MKRPVGFVILASWKHALLGREGKWWNFERLVVIFWSGWANLDSETHILIVTAILLNV